MASESIAIDSKPILAGILDAKATRRLEWKLKLNFLIALFYFPLQMTEGKDGNTAKG